MEWYKQSEGYWSASIDDIECHITFNNETGDWDYNVYQGPGDMIAYGSEPTLEYAQSTCDTLLNF